MKAKVHLPDGEERKTGFALCAAPAFGNQRRARVEPEVSDDHALITCKRCRKILDYRAQREAKSTQEETK